MSTTTADRPAPAETWDELDARLSALRREAAERKTQAIADGGPHEPGDETFVIGYHEDGRAMEVKVCVRCDAIARNAETCAQAEQYVRRVMQP